MTRQQRMLIDLGIETHRAMGRSPTFRVCATPEMTLLWRSIELPTEKETVTDDQDT